MKLLIFCALIAFTGAQVTNEVSGKAGMCPNDYFAKHPEKWHKPRISEKKDEATEDREKPFHHHLNFSQLQNCTEDTECNEGLKCCQTCRGTKKCLTPIIDNGNVAMCPKDYYTKYPEKKPKHDHKKDGGKPFHHFSDFSKLQNCTEDAECNGTLKCCESFCGTKKCLKPFLDSGNVAMCPKDYMTKYPEKRPKHGYKKDGATEDGEKPFHRFFDFSQLQNCTEDAECSGTLKCCESLCGTKKCLKPFFEKKEQETENDEPHVPVREKRENKNKNQKKGKNQKNKNKNKN